MSKPVDWFLQEVFICWTMFDFHWIVTGINQLNDWNAIWLGIDLNCSISMVFCRIHINIHRQLECECISWLRFWGESCASELSGRNGTVRNFAGWLPPIDWLHCYSSTVSGETNWSWSLFFSCSITVNSDQSDITVELW